jgi:hypothetical protein
MLRFILDLVTAVRVFVLCRTGLTLEILALCQQVAVLKRKQPRPKLNGMDRLFWTALRGVWPRWAVMAGNRPPDSPDLDGVSLHALVAKHVHQRRFRIKSKRRESYPSGSQGDIRENFRELKSSMSPCDVSLPPPCRRQIQFWRHTSVSTRAVLVQQ